MGSRWFYCKNKSYLKSNIINKIFVSWNPHTFSFDVCAKGKTLLLSVKTSNNFVMLVYFYFHDGTCRC